MSAFVRGIARRFGANYETIRKVLTEAYHPTLLQMNDDSSRHGEAIDSHFSLYIVSDSFGGKALIERHRELKSLLGKEGVFQNVHAISLVTRTPEEHEKATHGGAQSCCHGKGPHHHH